MSYESEILGGILIGLASALPLIYEGRVAGISGYASACLRPQSFGGQSSLFFILGLILGGFSWLVLGGKLPNTSGDISENSILWALAGLLVGFGSRLSGGCTSGHGVCGLGRMSPRSLASVVLFMSAAILTTVFLRLF